MKRLRSFVPMVFAAAAIVSVAAFGQNPDGTADRTFWLPERATSDPLPVEIDRLFNLILWITGATLVGVFAVLGFFLLKYRGRPDRKAFYSHGSHKVEVVWTIAPALVLLWLALVQAGTWLDIKAPTRMPRPNEATYVRVIAQQFSWNFRQAGADGMFERFLLDKFDADLATWREKANEEAAKYAEAQKNKTYIKTRLPMEGVEVEDAESLLLKPNALADAYWSNDEEDDVVSQGELVVPVGKPVLLDLRSVDVIHSFFLPHLRVKQDALPGKPTPVWFHPTKIGSYEIACAELCGNLHTTMKATMRVVSQADYDAYVAEKSGAKASKTDRRGRSQDVWRAWGAQDKQVIEARLR
jgi:cytochrome c oxidase subunit II